MAGSSHGDRYSTCDTIPISLNISGRTTSTTADGTTRVWEYVDFLTDLEEVDVDIKKFNALVGYGETYRLQGFTQVVDKRLDQLAGEGSVKTAIANPTDTGERVHSIGDEDDGSTLAFSDQLQKASTDRSAPMNSSS